MSHAQVLDLLHREANQMSGYGMDYECPHCDGSGLIGGFAGQKSIYARIDETPYTALERKARKAALFDALASAGEKARRKKKTPAQRLKAAENIVARGGVPLVREKGNSEAYNIAQALKLMEEFKMG